MILSAKAQTQWVAMQEKYLLSLPVKKARILACWQTIQPSACNSTHLSEFKTEIHRLSGSAGIYGLTTLGLAAKNLDRLLSADDAIAVLPTSTAGLLDVLMDAFDQAINHHSIATLTR